MGKILVIDDDNNIREMLEVLLKHECFDVVTAEDGIDGLDKFEREKIDIVVTDIMMPRMDGWQLCREIREFSDVPVLMLTVQGEISDKVQGFEIGADDYLTKPFEPDELIVRIRALLKRYGVTASHEVHIGALVIDRNKFVVRVKGNVVTLPLKEFELLSTLAEYPGKTFSRDYLIETIWGYDYEGNERTLDVHIGRLRERFSEKESGLRITTIRGLGYRLEPARGGDE